MAYEKKTWEDRVSEYPNRRTLVKSDNSQETVTVERSEGNISKTGDAFSAENMNDLETRIDDAFGGLSLRLISQSDYNSLTTKDSTVLYLCY